MLLLLGLFGQGSVARDLTAVREFLFGRFLRQHIIMEFEHNIPDPN